MKTASNELNRFVVVCDLRTGSRATFERGLLASGSVMPLGEKVWLLRATGTAGSVRNFLLQHIGSRDSLMVMQFAATRTATHNVGPEVDARLRAMLYLESDVAEVSRCA